MTDSPLLISYGPAPESSVIQKRDAYVAVDVLDWDRINDSTAVSTWLDSYKHRSENTQRSYRKEAERLLMWLEAKLGANDQLLKKATVREANAYLDYLSAPTLIPREILRRHGRTEQPIKGPLARASARQTMVILHRMFEALRNLPDETGEPYIRFNPWSLVRDAASDEVEEDLDAAFTPAEWEAIEHTIELLPRQTDREFAHHARSRWIMQLMYRTWLRRETVAKLKMSDFVLTPDGWLLKISGKGRKTSRIIATDRLMAELQLYRKANGLRPLPDPADSLPAVLSVIGKGLPKPMTGQAIYLICKTIFSATAERLQLEAPDAAKRLREASPHWLRHTGITRAMEADVNPRYVQAQAQHSSLKVTNRYDHKRKQRWRDQMDLMDSDDLRSDAPVKPNP